MGGCGWGADTGRDGEWALACAGTGTGTGTGAGGCAPAVVARGETGLDDRLLERELLSNDECDDAGIYAAPLDLFSSSKRERELSK